MIRIRRATLQDAIPLLEWRNDPKTIEMSRTQGSIEVSDHMKWFSRAIGDPARIILVAVDDDRRVGMVRLDQRDDGWLVSINLAPKERGKGYGFAILGEALAHVGNAPLFAEIKTTNLPSIRIFAKCGFKLAAEDGEFQRWTRPLS